MPFSSKTLLFAFIVSTGIGFPVSDAEAGPLIDWLFGRRKPAYAVGQPVPVNTAYAAGYGSYPPGYTNTPVANGNGYATNYGTYYNSQLPVIGPGGAGYTASPPSGITAATLPSTMTYVAELSVECLPCTCDLLSPSVDHGPEYRSPGGCDGPVHFLRVFDAADANLWT